MKMFLKVFLVTLLVSVSIQKNAVGDAIAWTASYTIGLPVEDGASGPYAFDATGLTYWAYLENKVAIPRDIDGQFKAGVEIPLRDIDNGDLLFFDVDHKGTASHVGIYMGDGEFIHAFQDRGVVEYAELNLPYFKSHFVGARRPW